jgi:hypothetical protein
VPSKQFKNWLPYNNPPASALEPVAMQSTQQGIVPLPGKTYDSLLNHFDTPAPYTLIFVSDESPGWDPSDVALHPYGVNTAPNYGFEPAPAYARPFPVRKWPRYETENSDFNISAGWFLSGSPFFLPRYVRPGTYRIYEWIGTGRVVGHTGVSCGARRRH